MRVPDASKLADIKGIGMVTTAVIVSEIGDIRRFYDPRQIQKIEGLSLKENSRNCKYKDVAFEFIKILLLDKIQSDDDFTFSTVRKDILKNDIKKFSGDLSIYGNKYSIIDKENNESFPIMPLSKILLENLIKVHPNLAKFDVTDKSVNTIINDTINDYLEGKIDEEQAAKVINDKVILFLNEQLLN